MPNYPQLDNARGVWNMKEVYDAVMGGYWPNALSRAVMGGGETPSVVNTIDKITMSSAGDAADFGDLTVVRRLTTGLSNFTRGIWAAGTPSNSGGLTSIDYVTIMSDGNAADFGDITNARYGAGGSSNSTRGLSFGGWIDPAVNNTIDYITMASTGAAADFGDLSAAKAFMGGTESTTRSVSLGGYTPTLLNVIEYVEMATLGDSIDFGDLTAANYRCTGTASSSTRGTVCGGANPGASNPHTRIEYITTASQGNSIDYADSNSAGTDKAGTSNSVRGLFMGGAEPSQINVIEYIAISAGGTALDFGDLTSARASPTAVSNSHGGLNDGYQGTRMPVVGASTRAVMGSGSQSPADSIINFIEYINISTAGDNSADFGDLTNSRRHVSACASTTRACFGGGATPSIGDVIDYVTIATIGNATDFGNLVSSKQETGSTSSTTRGIWFGGWTGAGSPYPGTDEIDYITIASTGNATDFGNLTGNKRNINNATASPTRAVTGGGSVTTPAGNIIEYVTIGSTGNSTDFGDLTAAAKAKFGTGSDTRGIFGGGVSDITTIDYITIASTGDAADFGDLTGNMVQTGATSNNIRGLLMGGGLGTGNSGQTDISYLTIATLGNEREFGDLRTGYEDIAATSGSHGGLQ